MNAQSKRKAVVDDERYSDFCFMKTRTRNGGGDRSQDDDPETPPGTPPKGRASDQPGTASKVPKKLPPKKTTTTTKKNGAVASAKKKSQPTQLRHSNENSNFSDEVGLQISESVINDLTKLSNDLISSVNVDTMVSMIGFNVDSDSMVYETNEDLIKKSNDLISTVNVDISVDANTNANVTKQITPSDLMVYETNEDGSRMKQSNDLISSVNVDTSVNVDININANVTKQTTSSDLMVYETNDAISNKISYDDTISHTDTNNAVLTHNTQTYIINANKTNQQIHKQTNNQTDAHTDDHKQIYRNADKHTYTQSHVTIKEAMKQLHSRPWTDDQRKTEEEKNDRTIYISGEGNDNKTFKCAFKWFVVVAFVKFVITRQPLDNIASNGVQIIGIYCTFLVWA